MKTIKGVNDFDTMVKWWKSLKENGDSFQKLIGEILIDNFSEGQLEFDGSSFFDRGVFMKLLDKHYQSKEMN